jgi:ATP-dependent DNA ligase
MVIDKSKFVKKAGDYMIAQTDGIADPVLLGTAAKYEEDFSASFRGLAPKDIAARYSGTKRVHWSLKYDGEGALVFYDEALGAVAFSAPSGRARIGMKALEEAASALKKSGVKKALLRGEIYLPSKKGKPRHGVSDVTRASFSKEKGEADKLTIALFDILMLDGKDNRDDAKSFEAEWDKLTEIFGDDESAPAHRARGGWCSGDELQAHLDAVLEESGEGIVVRSTTERDFAKIKPRLSIDAAILGYVEGSFDGKIGTRNILVGLNHPAKAGKTIFQSLARTGAGIDDKMAVDLLERLQSLKVEAPLLLNDSEGREVHFVKPEIIVEIEGEDWIHTRSEGTPCRSQAFEWNDKKNAWTYAGVANFPRLVFPAVAKLRDDKSIADGGARIAQVLEDAQPPAKPDGKTDAEILERHVYRKGADSVRKFLLAKRGGEDALPYIVTYTDFSAGRKEPLKVSTDYAYTEERAKGLLKTLHTANIKKGWEKV